LILALACKASTETCSRQTQALYFCTRLHTDNHKL
jgi:hypothetical protein